MWVLERVREVRELQMLLLVMVVLMKLVRAVSGIGTIDRKRVYHIGRRDTVAYLRSVAVSYFC
jgi:hypothetical protein